MKDFSNPKELEKGKLYLEKGDQRLDIGYAEIRASRIKFNKNFTMLWADQWKATGEITLDLLMWLIVNMKKGWVHRVTDEELAQEFKVTRKTIAKAKRRLHDAGILKYEAKAIFLNPEIFFRGGSPTQHDNAKAEYLQFKGIGDDKRAEEKNENFSSL